MVNMHNAIFIPARDFAFFYAVFIASDKKKGKSEDLPKAQHAARETNNMQLKQNYVLTTALTVPKNKINTKQSLIIFVWFWECETAPIKNNFALY